MTAKVPSFDAGTAFPLANRAARSTSLVGASTVAGATFSFNRRLFAVFRSDWVSGRRASFLVDDFSFFVTGSYCCCCCCCCYCLSFFGVIFLFGVILLFWVGFFKLLFISQDVSSQRFEAAEAIFLKRMGFGDKGNGVISDFKFTCSLYKKRKTWNSIQSHGKKKKHYIIFDGYCFADESCFLSYLHVSALLCVIIVGWQPIFGISTAKE